MRPCAITMKKSGGLTAGERIGVAGRVSRFVAGGCGSKIGNCSLAVSPTVSALSITAGYTGRFSFDSFVFCGDVAIEFGSNDTLITTAAQA